MTEMSFYLDGELEHYISIEFGIKLSNKKRIK